MVRWISKEQMKEYFTGLSIYSACFALIAWLFGLGLIAMAVSAWALMLFSVCSKAEYNGLAILGICAIFGTIFLAVTFFGNFLNPKTAWVNFYTVGALMSYSFIFIFKGVIKKGNGHY